MSDRRYFPALTGMRMVAALFVFAHHYSVPLAAPLDPLASRLQKEGYVGVAMFFVLSGFLITYRNYESSRLSLHSLRKYLQNRFARIYPLVFLLMALELVVARHDHQHVAARTIALNFTLLKGYVNTLKFTLLPQTWTLSAEETFYVLAPLLFFAARRGRFWLVLLLVPLGGVLFALTPANPGRVTDTLYFEATYTFFGASIAFALGGLLAVTLIRLGPTFVGARFPVFTLLGLGGFVLAYHYLGRQPANPRITAALLMPGHNAGWFSNTGIAIVGLFMPLALAVFYFGLIVESSVIRSVLSLPLMDTLGSSSYAFYLIQQGAIDSYVSAHVTSDWGFRLLLLTLISVILHRFVEVPLNVRLRFGGRPQAPLTASLGVHAS